MKPGEFWDWKFREHPDEYGFEPNDFLRLAAGLLPPGSKVLSLGEGEGRNALYLMRCGHSVTCVDASSVARDRALKIFADAARESTPDSHALAKRLDAYLVMDLERELPTGNWDAVVSIWCHLPPAARRSLHSAIPGWLRPGGLYIAEGYSPDQLRFKTGGPPEIELLYDPEILRSEIPDAMDLEIFQKTERLISEGTRHQGMSSTMQIVARRKSHAS